MGSSLDVRVNLVDDPRGGMCLLPVDGSRTATLDRLTKDANGGHVHELARLIQERRGDLSYGDIARQSGGALTRAGAQRLGAGDEPLREVPKPETIVGLARALGVSVDLVAVAALRSAGVPVRARFGGAEPLQGYDMLTEQQQDALQHLVTVMADPHASTRGLLLPCATHAPNVDRAGRLIAEALHHSGLRPRLAADVAHIPYRRWRLMLDGQDDASDEEWFSAAIVTRADPDAVFAALGRPVPIGQDEEADDPQTEQATGANDCSHG